MKKNFILLSLMLIGLSSCGFMPIQNQDQLEVGQIIFSENIPESMKIKFKVIDINKINNMSLDIKKYSFKERQIYGGSALRALEGELKAEIIIVITKSGNEVKKNLTAITNYSSNELNPLAEKETIKELEKALQSELIRQLVFEVKILEM